MRFAVVMLGCSVLCALSGTLTAAETVTLPNCSLGLDEEVQVPAQEPGVLVKIHLREGQQVNRDDVLAQIDDVVPQCKYNVALYKRDVAKKQATDDVDVRYASAALKVAEMDLYRKMKANRDHAGTVSDTEIDEKRLEKDKFALMVEKANKDRDVAALQQQVSEAELRAAKEDVRRRQITSPLNAMVVELSRREGEWVQAGEPIMRLMRLDVLRVEGRLNVKDYQPSEIEGRPVEVVVTLSHNQQVSVPGKIVFVKPEVLAGQFLVRAEVQNRRQGNTWVLSPGMSADMKIQLK